MNYSDDVFVDVLSDFWDEVVHSSLKLQRLQRQSLPATFTSNQNKFPLLENFKAKYFVLKGVDASAYWGQALVFETIAAESFLILNEE